MRSRVRPIDAADVAAGPNALRGSSPNRKHAILEKCDDPNGLSRSPERPYLNYVVMPSPIGYRSICWRLSRSHCTGDEQPSQVAIALLGDAAELVLAAGCVLLRHQSNPCREAASRAELLPVADLGNPGGGDKSILTLHRSCEASRRLEEIPGIGPIVAGF